MGFTKPLTINGFVNLGTAMRAAGYGGGGMVSSGGIFNPDAAVLLYLHLTETASTAPATGTDGWPIGAGATAAGNAFFFDRGANQSSLDIGTTWLYAPSSIVIKVIVTGA